MLEGHCSCRRRTTFLLLRLDLAGAHSLALTTRRIVLILPRARRPGRVGRGAAHSREAADGEGHGNWHGDGRGSARGGAVRLAGYFFFENIENIPPFFFFASGALPSW